MAIKRIRIVTPAPKGTTLGNRLTAIRWSRILRDLGYRVDVTVGIENTSDCRSFDCLIAIHASRSSSAVAFSKKVMPQRPVWVCLSGTDIHRDLSANSEGSETYVNAFSSLELADRVILLEPEGIKALCDSELRKRVRRKSAVIYQSATPLQIRPAPLKTRFEVSVIGHLRPVKDPFVAARATQGLPESSRIHVVQFGSALSDAMRDQACELERTHPRYRWLGARPHGETQRRLVRSRVTVLSSKMEGAPSLISEAIVNGVPLLATRIHATRGLLGSHYPGLFPVGDVKALRRLMLRSEEDPDFLKRLREHLKGIRKQFLLPAERSTWKKLTRQLLDH